MIKLIATDIDGTLLKDGTLMIDPEYMTVIEKLTSKGILETSRHTATNWCRVM